MTSVSIAMDAERSASQLLDTMWRGRGFPVDPQAIAAAMGLIVHQAGLPGNIPGGLVKDADKDPVILLTQCDMRARNGLIARKRLDTMSAQ